MILLEWNELFIFFHGQSRKIYVSLKNLPRYFKQGKILSWLIRFKLIIYQYVIKLIIIYLPVESSPYSCLLINFLCNQMTQWTCKLGKHHKPCSRSDLLVSYQRRTWGHGKYYGACPKRVFDMSKGPLLLPVMLGPTHTMSILLTIQCTLEWGNQY